MKTALSKLSKSPYIQSLLELMITEVFNDEKLLEEMTRELTDDLKNVNLDKGYLDEGEENRIKLSAGGFLGQLTRRIVNLTYQKFLDEHEENVNVFVFKTNSENIVDMFLHNIKTNKHSDTDDSELNASQEAIYKKLKKVIQEKLEIQQLINELPNPNVATVIHADVRLILLEDAQSVCYESVKTNAPSSQQEMFKEVVLSHEVSSLLAQYLPPATEKLEDASSILPLHQGFIQSAYENLYSSQKIYGEQSLDKLSKMYAKGFIQFFENNSEGQEVELSFKELKARLKANKFNPGSIVENFYSRLSP